MQENPALYCIKCVKTPQKRNWCSNEVTKKRHSQEYKWTYCNHILKFYFSSTSSLDNYWVKCQWNILKCIFQSDHGILYFVFYWFKVFFFSNTSKHGIWIRMWYFVRLHLIVEKKKKIEYRLLEPRSSKRIAGRAFEKCAKDYSASYWVKLKTVQI